MLLKRGTKIGIVFAIIVFLFELKYLTIIKHLINM